MKAKTQNNSGFTLLELLVVIGIIGVLATYILVSSGRSKIQSRDVRRLDDVRKVNQSLQLYYTNMDSYPPDCSDPGYAGGCDMADMPYSTVMADSSLDGQFVNFLTPDFLGEIPGDPLNDAAHNYVYATNIEYPSGSGDFYHYIVGVRLEDSGNNKGGITPAAGEEDLYFLGEKDQ
jgi:prepilin-type N-terminal cleavage/methylation domain-containing protein